MKKNHGIKTVFIIMAVIITGLAAIALSACGGSQAQATNPGPGQIAVANPKGVVQPTTITATTNGDVASIPLSQVTQNLNTRFIVDTPSGQMSYMAYVWNGNVNVRADICPPCGSRSFRLTNGTLICNACGTVFNAQSGEGKSGACVRYTKEAVNFQVSGDNINMTMADLVTAYQNTLSPD